MTAIKQAIEVLQKTNDGNDLSPFHLKILEMAVNGHLNDDGIKLFQAEIYTPVANGAYRKPWFHGIEHLTIRHSGYVYWKNARVEHYTIGWHLSEESRQAAIRLGAICREIEEKGEIVTGEKVWKYF
jgi:hypothetical protein